MDGGMKTDYEKGLGHGVVGLILFLIFMVIMLKIMGVPW